MAAALLHEPEILFLDEPTSGADPLARREFWRRITALAEQGVTVIVTTHFMEEAEYCDRVVILDAGRVLAQGTPAEIRGACRSRAIASRPWRTRSSPSSSGARRQAEATPRERGMSMSEPRRRASGRRAAPRADRKESRQLLRDPSSIAIGIVMPVMLILLFGYGLSLDVKNVPVAVVLEDLARGARPGGRLPAVAAISSRARDLDAAGRAADARPRGRRHRAHSARTSPAGWRGDAEVQVLVHGTDANTARIIQGYAQGAVAQWGLRRAAEGQPVTRPGPVAVKAGCGSTRPTTAAISWCPA